MCDFLEYMLRYRADVMIRASRRLSAQDFLTGTYADSPPLVSRQLEESFEKLRKTQQFLPLGTASVGRYSLYLAR